MLQSVNELRGYAIDAADARVGSVKDVYFDDERRIVRYLVVDTGAWLVGRRVLIPPPGIVRIDHAARSVRVWMTRQQIEESPSIDEDRPVSRQQEASLYRYWGYPLYWSGPQPWGTGSFSEVATASRPPAALLSPTLPSAVDDGSAPRGDPHLRSAREVIGYRVAATDGELGHVEDLIIDDSDWSLQEIGIDTSDWWPARNVRIPAGALDGVSWSDRTLFVRMSRSEIQASPGVTA